MEEVLSQEETDNTLGETCHHKERKSLLLSSENCQLCLLMLQCLDITLHDRLCEVLSPPVKSIVSPRSELHASIGLDKDYTYDISHSFTRPYAFDVYSSQSTICCCYVFKRHDFINSRSLHSGENVVANHIQSREILPHSDSAAAFSLMKHWLEVCQSHYACIRKSSNGPLPKRVLDTDPDGRLGDEIYLLVTIGQSGSYVALSYCWGGQTHLQLTRASLSKLQNGIALSLLPKTFRDTVKVLRSMGIRYLWIDSLCIIQDDSSDWEAEAASMRSIYAGSIFTISATFAKNPTEGLFKDRCFKSVEIPSSFLRARGIGEPLFIGAQDYMVSSSMAGCAPIKDRAWTLQERILPPAVLHFADQQMSWECRSGHYFESGDYEEVDPFLKLPASLAYDKSEECTDEFSLWYEIVKDYSTRKLTKKSDKLVALAGVAEAYPTGGSSTYLAGIWAADLPRGLLWQRREGMVKIKEQARHRQAPLNKRIEHTRHFKPPSWTWTCLDGRIEPPPAVAFLDAEANTGFDLQILTVHTNVIAADQYALVEGGSIKVEGLVQVSYYNAESATFEQDCDPQIRCRVDTADMDFSRNCWLLLVGTSSMNLQTYFLALDQDDPGNGTFKRFGLAYRERLEDGSAHDPAGYFKAPSRMQLILV
jgi:Heterokaryon incompatibility protein (HET)